MQHHLAPSTPRYSPYLSSIHSPAPVYLAGHVADPNSSPYGRKSRSPQNFKCPYEGCEAAFDRDVHLTRHERTHSQEKPFHCTLGTCDKWFSRLDNVRQHIKSQHASEVADGQAELLMRGLASLQKQISAQAAARRRARRTESTESVPSMNGLRLSPGHAAGLNGTLSHSPELIHSYPSSSSASASSVSPPTPSDSPPHGPAPLGNPHMRMQSAPAYLPHARFNPSPSPSLLRQSFYGSASEDNIATLAKIPSQTWTPPPMPTHRFAPPLQRKMSLPSGLGLPPLASGSGNGMPTPLASQTHANGHPPSYGFGFDEYAKPGVSPTTAFFNMALNGYNAAEDHSNGVFRFGASETGMHQTMQPGQMPGSPNRRPSSSTLLDYVLSPPQTGAPDHVGPVAIVPSMPPGSMDPIVTHHASPRLAVETGIPNWASQPASLGPPPVNRSRSHLSSPVASSSPRLSPSTSSPHRFDGLAAAFQRTHSSS